MIESAELLRVRTRSPGGANWLIPAFGEGLFADTDVPVIVGGTATYAPLEWARTAISSSLVDARDDLEIIVPQDCDLAVALRNLTAPWQIEVLRATALVRDADHLDTSTTERIAIVRVSEVAVSGSLFRIVARAKRSLLERVGPRDRFSDACRHALYGVSCGVDPTTVQDVGTVTSVVGDTIAAGLASAAGYLVGGFAVVAGQTRLIVANAGDGSVRVDRPWNSPASLVTETITCVPGCNRTVGDCETKFANLPNFGGIPTSGSPWSRRRTWGGGAVEEP